MRIFLSILFLIPALVFGAAKVSTQQEGVYYLSASNLSLSLNIHLTSCVSALQSTNILVQNKNLPVQAVYSSNGIKFFAQKHRSLFTDHNVFIVSVGKGLGIESITNSQPQNRFVEVETNKSCLLDYVFDKDEDPWVGNSIGLVGSFKRTNTSTVILPSILSNESIVFTMFGIVSATNTLQFSFQNQVLGTAVISGVGRSNFYFDTSLISPAASNIVKISVLNGSLSDIYIDKYVVNYSAQTSSYPEFTGGLSAVVFEDLKSQTNEVDYLVIAPTNLLSSAQKLVDYRKTNGLLGRAVSIEAIYNEFNFGFRDPRAIRNFIGYSSQKWKTGPRYFLLLGHGSVDYKGYLSDDALIPTLTSVSPTIGLSGAGTGIIGSDNSLADFDEDGVVDVCLGRLPIRDTNEFEVIFNKIKRFESNPSKTNGLITAGSSAGGFSFTAEADFENSISPKLTNKLNYVDSLGFSLVRSNLIGALNSGVNSFIYLGEGNSSSLFSGGQILFRTQEIDTLLTNSPQTPAMISLACLVSDIGTPNWNISFSEKMLVSTNGSCAVFGAGAQVWEADSYFISRTLVSNLYYEGESRLGDAILPALQRASDYSITQMVMAVNLLGDPAMMMLGDNKTRPLPQFLPKTNSFTQWLKWAVPVIIQDEGVSEFDDLDDDGSSNHEEYLMGTDPLNINSVLRIIKMSQISITWNAENHLKYTVEGADSVLGPWNKAGEIDGIWPETSFGATNGFFRVGRKF